MYELSSIFDEGSIRKEGDVEFDGIFSRRIFTPSIVSILIACTYRFFFAYPCMCQGELTGNVEFQRRNRSFQSSTCIGPDSCGKKTRKAIKVRGYLTSAMDVGDSFEIDTEVSENEFMAVRRATRDEIEQGNDPVAPHPPIP